MLPLERLFQRPTGKSGSFIWPRCNASSSNSSADARGSAIQHYLHTCIDQIAPMTVESAEPAELSKRSTRMNGCTHKVKQALYYPAISMDDFDVWLENYSSDI